MERRADERFEVQFETRVTVLSNERHSALGRVTDISNSGISVDLPFQLAAGDLVELEMADSTLYGQVVYSNAVYSNAAYSNKDSSLFRTGIEASRVLLGGTELSSILQRVLLEALPEMPGLETAGALRD
jgi:hypothetical protein